ncbi:thiol:disulfide interchange protein DsbA [Arsenophonus nasoniae]|uniref:Thiol:disulfide interchange protein n=1 Tax=Arsenophonus nasoniae TaxID=638 RepID=D2U3K1_9GAMM|nr:thiol:disulfide interchange protein DsbA [Arsenophonus nasoniae]QBY45581.1 Thiol:disulfide interchange protein DsbA [Arsenophonus nasoniae]WGM05700.1 thiol:disulfide interchange protein DsbA [Arsenophonus nasoniae]WGM10711.1 thiol:disulfide interchange protein DsbA [Arsenophonus nasoniae]WGM15417.1 thiol:disulfide interchange protein DsbA [Arsenophonus nasoniae]CBA75935.1 periplasmic protein disulfide isomerase I [Arsenophonus nasoniae]
MNKFWLVLIGLVMSYGVSAASYTEGTEFIKIQKTVQNAPRVVEFFSFYCPHCYQFESVYHVSQTVAKNLPKDIKMERYHVDFLGPLGAELTKASTVAMVLKVEDKVSPLLFEGIQKSESINTPADIKAVFIKAGVKSEEYDAALNSFVVKSLVVKQQQAANDFQLRGVPAMFVNGKYMVRNNGITIENADHYAKAYSDVVNFLISK